jgi:hypothetical protein
MAKQRTAEESRICAAASSMPYGAMVHHTWPETITLASVGDYLHKLREVLRGISVGQQESEEELSRLQSVIRGGALLMAELCKAKGE